MAGIIPNPKLNIWTDESQQNLLTPSPITLVHSVGRDMQVNSPYQHTLELELSDALTGGIGRSMYAELTVGSANKLWASGYVLDKAESASDSSQYTITLSSPLLALSNVNNLGMFVTDFPDYKTVIDCLNGVHPAGQPSTPFTKGMLDFAGWSAVWVTGPGWPQQPVGVQGKGRGDWGTAMQNVMSLANIYALYFRERWGSRATRGILEFGPLSDPSGIAIWGGDNLAARLGLPAGTRPQSGAAQAAGLIDISNATYHEAGGNVKNLIWPLGHGTGPNMITLRSIFGDVFMADNRTLAPGVQVWQPNPQGENYYVQASNYQTWKGHTYELVAAQQWNGEFAYGLIDRTSAAKYGVIELHHHYPKATTPELLLALGAGTMEKASDPPPEWTFACRHPMNREVPQMVMPGQTIDVNYSGYTHKANTYNPASGQWEPSNDYEYMSWPNVTDPQQLINVKRVVQVTDTWDANGYTATYTMGSTPKKPKQQTMLLSLARQFEEHQHHTHTHHRWKDEKLHGVEFLCTQNPLANFNHVTEELWLRPGSMCVADVPSVKFFGNHKRVAFTLQLTDPKGCVDFMFAKPLGSTIKRTDVTGAQIPGYSGTPQYGVVRLCASGFQGPYSRCGIYTTTDGQVYTHRGVEPHKHIFDNFGRLLPGTYRVHISMSGGIVEVHIQQLTLGTSDNVGSADLACLWHDHDGAITTWGTIGWYYQPGASASAILSQLHYASHHRTSKAGHGGNRGRHAVVTEGARGGFDVRHTDSGGNFAPVKHRLHPGGHSSHADEHRHGPYHPSQVACSTVVADTADPSLLDVNFATLLPPGSIKGGYIVYDPAGDWVKVKHAIRDAATGNISGFATRDQAAANFAGQGIFWDPLDVEGAPTAGHRRTGAYFPSKGGWAIMDIPADGDEKKAFVVYADGTTGLLGGAKVITQPNGDIVAIGDLAVKAGSFAKGVERDGAALFDAGELESATQSVDLFAGTTAYPSAYGPNSVISGDPTGFTDLTLTNAAAAALWVAKANDGTPGDADAILMLNTGQYTPPGLALNTFNGVRWYDSQILTEEGAQRQYTVRRNSSFTFPFYYGIGGGASGLRLGAIANIKSVTGSTIYLDRTVSVPGPNGGVVQTSVGDTWAVGQGLSTVDVGTVTSVDPVNNAITFSGLTHSHSVGELLALKTALDTVVGSPTYNTRVAVQSGMLLDGSLNSDHVVPAIDIVCVGFYTIDRKTLQRNWYRAYWGNPEWVCPWAGAPGAPVAGVALGGALTLGNNYTYAVSLVTASGETLPSIASQVATPLVSGPNTFRSVNLTAIPIGPTGVTARKVYRSTNGGAFGLVQTISDNTTTTWSDTGAAQGAAPPVIDTAVVGAANPAYIGPLPGTPNAGEWVELLVKAAQPTSYGKPLFSKGTANTQKIVGVEIGMWSVNPGSAGQTGYFDAHQHGASTNAAKQPAGTVGSGQVKPGTVKTKHKNPTHNADAHVHSDFTFWCDSGNTVHWETGTLELHDGTSFTINGGNEDTPNAGVAGGAGMWILFNSWPHAVQLRDGGVTVTLPAYSAAGGTGGQTTGFGCVSAAYNFKARTGSGTVQRGLPDGVFKIGKVGRNIDVYTGELPVHGHHGSAKKHGKHQRAMSSHRRAHHPHHQHRLHFVNAILSIRNTNQLHMIPHGTTAPVAQWDHGGSHTFAASDTTLLTGLTAGQVVLFDLSTFAWSAVAPTTNLATDANVNKVKVGHVSFDTDPANGNYIFHMYHPGSHENTSVHHAAKSHLRRHDHPHKAHRLHFVNAHFSVLGGTQPVLRIDGHAGGTAMVQWDDGSGSVALTGGQVLGASASDWPGGTYAGAHQAVILFDVVAHTFSAAAATTDLGLPQYINSVKVGHLSQDYDPSTGNLIFHMYHPGSHENASLHMATKSHTRRHKHPHDQSKHHHHNVIYKATATSGSFPWTCTVSWSAGSIIDDTGATIANVSAGSLSGVAAGSMILYNAASGIVLEGINPNSFGAVSNRNITIDADIPLHLVARVVDAPDSVTGQLYLEGHHHGSHQVHGGHHAGGSVSGSHMNYIKLMDFTYAGAALTAVGSTTASWAWISQPVYIPFTPPFPLTYFHAGQWSMAASSSTSISPDTGPAPVYHHLQLSNVPSGGQEFSSSVWSNAINGSDLVQTADTKLYYIINSISRNMDGGTVQIRLQAISEYLDTTPRTIYPFIRWHAHNSK